MKIEDVIALAHAGFTAEQIAAMNQPQIQPQMQNQMQNQNDPMSALLAQMGILTNTVQNMNINNSAMPQPESADQILANIINPPKAVNKEVSK